MALLLAALALAPHQPVADCAMITFSRSPSFERSSEQVRICRDRSNNRGASHYVFYLAVTNPARSAEINTRTCPAARAQLQALERLDLPAPRVAFLDRELETSTFDGTAYRLETDASYGTGSGSLIVESNVRTPLAR